MKIFIKFILLILVANSAHANNLFESSQPVSLTITAPFKKLFDTRSESQSVLLDSLEKSVAGILQVINPNTQSLETYDVELTMRGNYTLMACQFPKLKIKFKKEQTKKDRYFNKKKYDLATHCVNSVEGITDPILTKFFSSSPHREKFLFDIQEQLSIAVPKTQNALINYIDNSESALIAYNQKPAFFIENKSNMIERLNGLYQVIGEYDFSKKIIQGQATNTVDDNFPRNIFKNIQDHQEINKNESIKLHLFSSLVMNYDFYIKIDSTDSRDGNKDVGFHNVKCIAISETEWRLHANDLNFASILQNNDQTSGQGRIILESIQDANIEKTITRVQKIGTTDDFNNVILFYKSKKDDLYKMADSLTQDPMFMKNYLMYLDVFYKKIDNINK